MAHYFFHAIYLAAMVTDDIGEEFATVEAAQAHAAVVANELGRNNTQPVTVVASTENCWQPKRQPASGQQGP